MTRDIVPILQTIGRIAMYVIGTVIIGTVNMMITFYFQYPYQPLEDMALHPMYVIGSAIMDAKMLSMEVLRLFSSCSILL